MKPSACTVIATAFWLASMAIPYAMPGSAVAIVPFVAAATAFAFTVWVDVRKVDDRSRLEEQIKMFHSIHDKEIKLIQEKLMAIQLGRR